MKKSHAWAVAYVVVFYSLLLSAFLLYACEANTMKNHVIKFHYIHHGKNPKANA